MIEVKAKGSVISYMPGLFQKIRQNAGIMEAQIIQSMDPVNNREQIFKSNQKTASGASSNSGGASSSFFFLTQDMKYIVKTMPEKEKYLLMSILKDLEEHKKQAPSLISEIVGIFKVNLNGFEPVNLVVMKNLAEKLRGKAMRFDIKGSKYKRRELYKENISYSITMKDQDLSRILLRRPYLINLDRA